jgi:TRAP-type mannitol/chloroaromatic compound transport system substrate-binding protein
MQERRKFLRSAATGAATGGAILGAPAIISAQPAIRWRLVSSFPKPLDTLYGASETIAKYVSTMSGGKFTISAHAAGEIVPGLQVLDAVQNGTVEAGHTPLYYYFGKDTAFAFDTAVPFGLNYRQQAAWLHEGGGIQLMRDFLKEYGCHNIPSGNTGAQMGGWFRKEINTLEDLKGLKFRCGGPAGQVLSKLGVVPQQLAAGDIYPSLEKGTIDAAEWVGPYDDEKLGFAKVAKYYYYPGWWEGGPSLSLLVGQKHWDALPPEYKAMLEAACGHAMVEMMAKYDARNAAALKRLVAGGAILRPFPRPVMEACFKATEEWFAENNAKNPKFKKIHDSWVRFRTDAVTWFRVTENTFDDFMAAAIAGRRT